MHLIYILYLLCIHTHFMYNYAQLVISKNYTSISQLNKSYRYEEIYLIYYSKVRQFYYCIWAVIYYYCEL